MAAYAFGRLRFRFGGAVLAILVGTMIVPIFVVVISLFKILADNHLIDTRRGLVLVFVATLTPLATWLLYTQVREMPTEPEEAALIDGCRRWQAFVRIVVPQMSSGIAAVAAIMALSVWGEFLIPLLLTQTMNAKPVTVQITEYVGKYTTNYPILAAAAPTPNRMSLPELRHATEIAPATSPSGIRRMRAPASRHSRMMSCGGRGRG